MIINYYSKSSTMKLDLQKGTIDMAFRDFTPTEYAALGNASGITVFKGSGVVIRYLVLNVKRAPTNKLAVRKAIAYLFPRPDIASRVYHGNVQPLYSMVPAGLPGSPRLVRRECTAWPRTRRRRRRCSKAAHVKTPVKLTVWWTPSHYGDASADEYTEIQRALNASGLFKVTLKSAEWTTYSKTLGTQYGAFQLGWFPDYVDAEDYLAPFYGSASNFTSNGYKSNAMDAILKNEAAAKTHFGAARLRPEGADARGEGRPDHPVLAGRDARGRPVGHPWDPGHARSDVPHAVLGDHEVLIARRVRGVLGRPSRLHS